MSPTVAEIKKMYQELTVLLNRLEGAGEVLDLIDDPQYGKIVQGQTGKTYRYDTPKTWGWA